MPDVLSLISAISICLISLPLVYYFGKQKKATSTMVAFELLLLTNLLIFEVVFLQPPLRSSLIFLTLVSFMTILIFLETFFKNPRFLDRFFGPLYRKIFPKPIMVPSIPGAPSSLSLSLEECLSASERDFNLLTSLIVMAKETHPDLDEERVRREFDQMVTPLLPLKKARIYPGEVVEKLNHHLFDTLGFQTDHSPNKQNDLANLLIHEIFQRKKAYCIGLSALYLLLAHRLELPIFGVSVPGHFFVRYDGQGMKRNIETTAKGSFYTDEYYKKRYSLLPQHLDQGLYLANLATKEVLVEFLNNRGNYFYRQGLLDLAERDFNRAITFSVNFVAAYTSKGFVALRKGDLRTARNYFQEALQIDPTAPMALLSMGEIYMRLNNLDQAELYLKKLVEVDGENPLAYTNLGLIQARKGKLEESVELHKKSLYHDPHCLYAHNNLGATYYRQKKYDESLASFHYVLKINPKFFPAMHNIIRTLRGAGMEELARTRKDELIAYYQKLREKEPDNDKYLFEMARLYQEAPPDLKKSIQLIREALKIRPSYPDYVELLAQCYAMKGEILKAYETIKFFLEKPSPEFLYDRRRMEEKVKKYARS